MYNTSMLPFEKKGTDHYITFDLQVSSPYLKILGTSINSKSNCAFLFAGAKSAHPRGPLFSFNALEVKLNT